MTTNAMWKRLAAVWRSTDLGVDLAGAACKGRAPLFDDLLPGERPGDRQQRHQTAARLCATCPELAACRSLLPTLPDRAGGIWAGVLVTANGITDPQQLELLEEETA